jgi:anti-anti-sigma factor
MRKDTYPAPRLVVRREADAAGVRLRLIGELDLCTVELVEAELGPSGARTPTGVFELSELGFLDLAGMRALLGAERPAQALDTRLVGATGIVRQLLELVPELEAEARRRPPARPPVDATP